MDIDAAMLRAVGALNHMADTCQYLEQKAALRQISQELISARVAMLKLVDAVDEVSAIYRPMVVNMRTGTERSIAWWHVFDARSRIGAANG